jgi:hypothetical protein
MRLFAASAEFPKPLIGRTRIETENSRREETMAKRRRKATVVSQAIVAASARHEGRPRTSSASRPQESWEEFKEKSNAPAETVLEEITQPRSPAVVLRRSLRRAGGLYRAYAPYLWAGVGLIVTALIWSRRRRGARS